MKIIPKAFAGLLLVISCSEPARHESNNATANVDRIHGKFIFIHAVPTHKYTIVNQAHLNLIEGVINSGSGQRGAGKFLSQVSTAVSALDFNNRLNQMIDQLQADNIDFDGIVFPDDLKDGYAIKFEGK